MTDYGVKFHTKRIGKPWYAEISRACQSLFKPTSVLDIGCSCGVLLAEMQYAHDRVGVDFGVPKDVFLRTAGGYVDHDLTKDELKLGKTFDLVICMEVAEHIDFESSKRLIKSISQHANRYVLFSAAHPGQPGKGHINCLPSYRWIEMFAKEGLFYDSKFTNHCIVACGSELPSCYLDNLFVVVKGE